MKNKFFLLLIIISVFLSAQAQESKTFDNLYVKNVNANKPTSAVNIEYLNNSNLGNSKGHNGLFMNGSWYVTLVQANTVYGINFLQELGGFISNASKNITFQHTSTDDRLVVNQAGAGLYVVTFNIDYTVSSSIGNEQIAVYKNESSVFALKYLNLNGNQKLSRTSLVYLSANDYISFRVQSSSAGKNLTIQEFSLTMFRIDN